MFVLRAGGSFAHTDFFGNTTEGNRQLSKVERTTNLANTCSRVHNANASAACIKSSCNYTSRGKKLSVLKGQKAYRQTKMHKFLAVVVLLSLVVAVTSESEESKRGRSCGMRAGNRGSQCKSNTSFIKRIFDAYKRGGVAPDTPEERDWVELEAERRGKDADTVQEKLRLLNELLEELDLYDNNMK